MFEASLISGGPITVANQQLRIGVRAAHSRGANCSFAILERDLSTPDRESDPHAPPPPLCRLGLGLIRFYVHVGTKSCRAVRGDFLGERFATE